MSKRIFFENDARARLLKGAKIAYDAVKVTYGPKGRNVGIGRDYTTSIVTHDGVTVARSIDLPAVDDDTLGQNMGVEFMREVSSNLDRTGDGTTSAPVLTYNIFAEACRLIAADYNPQEISSQLNACLPLLISSLDKITETISSNDVNRVAEIATISAEDPEIGRIIADVVNTIGKDGIISVDISKARETFSEIVEGYTYDKGYASPFFITDVTRQEALYEDIDIMVLDTKLNDPNDIFVNLSTRLSKNRPRTLIVCEDISPEALSFLATNKNNGSLDVVVAKAPGYGAQRSELLEDIATLTGATVIKDFETDNMEKMGLATKVIVGKNSTTIIGDAHFADAVSSRVLALKAQLEKEDSEFDKDRLNKRIAALTGKVAIIKVGGASEAEINKRKDAVDDAVGAVKAALAEGIVPGGCTTFLHLATLIDESTPGNRIIKKALRQPFLQLMENSNLNGPAMLAEIDKASWGMGYDVMHPETLVDMKIAGIIDPTLVIKEVIINSISVASINATLGLINVDIPEKPLEFRD